MANAGERPIAYYWHIVKTKKWMLVLVFVITVASTTLGSILWTPSYEATSAILLDYANPNPLDVMMPGLTISAEYMLTEQSMVQSKNVALRVIDGLKLAENPSIKEAYEKSKMAPWQQRIFFWQREKDIKQWLLDFMVDSLVVTPVPESRVINITFKSADPNFSAAVANAYAWAYSMYHLELKVVPLKEQVEWFSKKVDELRRDVEKKEKGFEDYKADKGVVNSDDRYNIATQKLNQLNSDLVSAENKFYDLSIKVNLVQDLQDKGGNYESLPEVLSSNLIQNLKVDKIKLEKEISEISKKVGTNHPHYLKTVAELQTIQEKIKSEINNIVTGTMSDYRSAKKRRETLKEAVDEQKNLVLKLNKDSFNLNMLSLEAQTSRKIYDTLLTKFSETTLRGDINRTNIIIVDKAIPPTDQSSPKVILNILLSMVLSVPLGIAVVFTMEFLDNTVKGEEDIEIDLGLSVLGTIPKR